MFPRTHATVVAAIALAAGLTACSGAAAETARSDPPRATGTATAGVGMGVATAPVAVRTAARRVRCVAEGIPTRPVPAGFVPAAVVECATITVSVPGGGVKTEEKREVAVGGLAPLLRALRQPSAHHKGVDPACMVPASRVPWLVLISRDGQEIHPLLPVGACGLPIVELQLSLRSLRWISLGVSPVLPSVMPSTAPSDELVTGRPPLQGGPVHRITPGSSASSPGA